ncbi:MAG: ribosome-associated translation inhibitor RaiA [Candidatus Peregrinibacteria bacterium]
MKILHFEKGFSFTDAETKTVARKLGKLATYCKTVKDESSAIRIEVEKQGTKKERDQVMVSISVELPGKILRAESRKPDILEALDRTIEKLEPQVKRYKEMKMNKSVKGKKSTR